MLPPADSLQAALRHFRAGRFREAERIAAEVLRADPAHVGALNLLGSIAGTLGVPEAAAAYFGRAVAARPLDPAFRRNLATACRDAGRTEEAIAHYEEALRLDPASPVAHVGLAEALMEQGRFPEAVAQNRATLALDPDCALAYANLGELAGQGQYTFCPQELQRLQALAARDDLPPADAGLVHFTLGSVRDRQGAPDQAFFHYRRGHELKREVYRLRGEAFDPGRYRQRVEAVMACFTRDFFERQRGRGSPSEVPVFVVGMVRSGTTLVEQILASHPRAGGAGELRDIEQIALALPGRLGTAEPFPACMSRLDAATALLMAELYLQRLTRAAAGAVRVVDKMPHNFLYLGLIATLFPRARIVHCRRDPLDLGASIYFQNFKWLPYATSFEEIRFVYEQYLRLMAHWRRHLPLAIHEASYEDVVGNLEGETRRLLTFCGLDWDERCLAFHDTRRPVQTASRLQVRRPIYKTSVGRWKRYETHLAPLLEAMRCTAERGAGGEPAADLPLFGGAGPAQ